MSEPSKLTQAYDRMIERVKTRLEAFEQAERDALPNLQRAIEEAVDNAVELGELSREEAKLVGSYVKRDLKDAGHYLASTGNDLGQWLRFDLELIEDRIWDLFSSAADKTRLEMLAFQETIERAAHYHTGEITGPGTLRCEACGKLLHFHAPAHIPPCPKCHKSDFSRTGDEQD